MNKIKHFMLPEHTNSLYEKEAISSIALAREVANKINEIVDSINELSEIDLTWKQEQEGTIRKGILYMKDNLVNTLHDLASMYKNDGIFEDYVKEYTRELEGRLTSVISGVVADDEILDARYGLDHINYDTLGEAIRNQFKYEPLNIVFDAYKNKFISTSGNWVNSEGFHTSNPIPLTGAGEETLFVHTYVLNQYVSKLTFLKNNHVVSTWTPTAAGIHKINVPSGVDSFVIASETNMDGVTKGEPIVLRVRDTTKSAIIKELNLLKEGFGYYIKKEVVFNKNIGFLVNTYGWKENVNFSMSDPIGIDGEKLLVYITGTQNQHISKVVFSAANKRDNQSIISTFETSKIGKMIIPVPTGAKYVFLASETNVDGVTSGEPQLFTLHPEMNKIFENIVSQKEKETLKINLPESYTLVVNDTFELFYEGVIKVNNLDNYDVKVRCEKGKNYKRKFVYTPTTNDVGEYTFTLEVRNNNGDIVGVSATTLKIVNANPSVKHILCVGDSLTAGGEWITETKARFTKIGQSSINFIKEATGGYTYDNYLALNNANPFYDGDIIDIGSYVRRKGFPDLDTCIILLGWNMTNTTEQAYKEKVISFINLVKESYPNVNILLYGLQLPSRDGLGENYGCEWDYLSCVDFVFNLDKWNREIAESENVKAVNISGQFDSVYNMPTEERNVNVRNNHKELVGVNGVHPSNNGYLQIADATYRELCGLNEV